MSRGPELKLQDKIVRWLNSNQIMNWRISSTNMSNFPDLLCNYKGHFVALEIKRDETTRARQGQERTVANINTHGGYARIVGSLEQVTTLFNEIEEEIRAKNKT